jgi:hypothetical protein
MFQTTNQMGMDCFRLGILPPESAAFFYIFNGKIPMVSGEDFPTSPLIVGM